MKNLFNLSLLAVLALFTAVACESINSSEKDTGPGQKQEQEISVRQAANPDNPYDETGAMHNEFLDFYIENNPDTVFRLDNIERTARIFYEKTGREMSADESEVWAATMNEYETMGFPYPGESAAEFPGDPCEIYPLICELEDIMGVLNDYIPSIESLDDNSEGTSTERTLAFVEQLKNQEKAALADRELDEEQRQVILLSASVARYSAVYWHNVKHIQQEKSAYFEYLKRQEAAGMTLGGIVRADRIGAIVGGILGGPSGAFIGGAAASVAAAVS